jgi:hypothetical protein
MKVRLSIALLMLLSWNPFSLEYKLTNDGERLLDSVYSSYIVRSKIPELAIGIILHDTVIIERIRCKESKNNRPGY